jgi:hypothetical protein
MLGIGSVALRAGPSQETSSLVTGESRLLLEYLSSFLEFFKGSEKIWQKKLNA